MFIKQIDGVIIERIGRPVMRTDAPYYPTNNETEAENENNFLAAKGIELHKMRFIANAGVVITTKEFQDYMAQIMMQANFARRV